MVQKERDGLEGAKIEAEKFINIEREVLINKGYLLKKQLYVENDINFSGSAIDGTLRISKKIMDRIRANCYGDYTIFDVCIYDYNTRDAIYPYIGKLYHSKEKYGKSDVLRKTQIHQER